MIPLTLPKTETTTTNLYGTVNSYGNVYGTGSPTYYNNFTNFSGTVVQTTTGTETTYIHQNVKKYDYGATYWAKYKLGITTFIIGHADFKPELRQRIRSNKGIQVLASIKATPAYNADIMTGNVLLKLNEHVIRSKNDIRHLIKDNEGKVFKVELWRNGNIITKNVKVGNPIIE